MLKSWKTRALAVAGVAIAAAPMVVLSSAGAVAPPPAPGAPTLTPVNGPPGTTVSVQGTGCGTAAEAATRVTLFLSGPTITTPGGQAFAGTVSAGTVYTGSVTIPTAAREGDSFTVAARCDNATGQGTTLSPTATFTTTAASILPPVTVPPVGGLTSTSGQTSATGTVDTTTGTTGATTAVAVPITQQPTFTG